MSESILALLPADALEKLRRIAGGGQQLPDADFVSGCAVRAAVGRECGPRTVARLLVLLIEQTQRAEAQGGRIAELEALVCDATESPMEFDIDLQTGGNFRCHFCTTANEDSHRDDCVVNRAARLLEPRP